MEANKIRLLEFLGSNQKTFNIPVYQRNYDWKKEQCLRLFKDIENIAVNDFKINHFIGTIVYANSEIMPNFTEFILIDGQQRITSLTLLIKALYDTISDSKLKEEIYETYLINKWAPEKLRVKLKPVESDCKAYEDVIAGGNKYEDTNIVKNYVLFKKLIEKSPVTPENLYRALNNLELVYIALDKDKENPQQIFESLNSTGLSLTQADLIRNFLLMNHSYDEQTRLFKDYWLKIESLLSNSNISDYIRDYLTMKTGIIPNKNKVYDAFKNYAHSISADCNEECILKELLLYSDYYSWFIFCNSPNLKVNRLLIQLQKLKSTVSYPFLLYIFKGCFHDNKISVNDLNDILKTVISYIYRRLICEYPTNTLNKIFASLSKEIQKSAKESYNGKVLDILTQKTHNAKFPRNEEFKSAFVSKDLYKTKLAKYTLFQLENSKSKETVDSSNQSITIEHIMPQKLSPAWQIELGKKFSEIHAEKLNTIGNLTLSGYNSEMSNKSFAEKKLEYEKSNIALNRSIAQFDSWNEEAINKRADILFEAAKEIWGLPSEYDNKQLNPSPIDYSAVYNIMDDIDITGEKPKQLIILDTKYNIKSWKDMLKEICKQLYELEPDIFRTFIKHIDFLGRNRKIIDSEQKNMTSPFKVADNLYIETNLSANEIINYSRIMSEHYSLQDDISFSLRAK